MSSPDERATGSARSDAVRLVEEALKSGRIVQADHDMRIAQLRGAQTMQELDLQVRDLRAAAPTTPVPAAATVGAPAAPPPTGQQSWPLVNYGPATVEAPEFAQAAAKGGKLVGGVIALIVLVSVVVPIAGAIIAFVSARDSFPDFGDLGPTDTTTYAPGQAPGSGGVNVHTVDGYQELVDALEEESGAAYAFSAVIYPRYAVLEVPTGKNDRYERYYWDGETLEPQDSRGSTTVAQVDLAVVDPGQIIDMLDTVRGRIEDPESWYVVIGANDPLGVQVSAYASNAYSESTYLIEGLDGTVIYDSDAAG